MLMQRGRQSPLNSTRKVVPTAVWNLAEDNRADWI